MNTVTFNPKWWYGTLLAIVLLALVLSQIGFASASGTLLASVEKGSKLVMWAAAMRIFPILIPAYFVILAFVSSLLGRSWKNTVESIRKRDGNDSINVLVGYLWAAFALVLVTVTLNPAFLMNLAIKEAIMFGYGIVVSTAINAPFFGLSGKQFFDELTKPGSDALARNIGWSFVICALATAFYL